MKPMSRKPKKVESTRRSGGTKRLVATPTVEEAVVVEENLTEEKTKDV